MKTSVGICQKVASPLVCRFQNPDSFFAPSVREDMQEFS